MTAALNGRRSAYPPEVAALVPRARELAEEIGRVPSRNVIMKEFKIGAPKATAVIEALSAPETVEQPTVDPGPAEPSEVPEVEPIRRGRLPVAWVHDGSGWVSPDGRQGVGEVAQVEPDPVPAVPAEVPVVDEQPEPEPQPAVDGHPGTPTAPRKPRRPVAWPVLLLAAPAFVAIWSGWVGLGEMAGFGVVTPLPGIADGFQLNTAITLPIGMEAYAAYALWVWLSDRAPVRARRFARWSALLALVVGAAGQVAYHLLAAAGITAAPWPIVTAVSCLPVAVLGMGAALAHLLHAGAEVES